LPPWLVGGTPIGARETRELPFSYRVAELISFCECRWRGV